MKRLIIAIAAFVAVFSLCVTSLWMLKTTYNGLIEEITDLEKIYARGDKDECQKKTSDLRNQMKTKTNWMQIFFNQNYIKEIDECIQLAEIYANEEKWEDFRAQLQRCHHSLNEIYDMEFPSWTSIF